MVCLDMSDDGFYPHSAYYVYYITLLFLVVAHRFLGGDGMIISASDVREHK